MRNIEIVSNWKPVSECRDLIWLCDQQLNQRHIHIKQIKQFPYQTINREYTQTTKKHKFVEKNESQNR